MGAPKTVNLTYEALEAHNPAACPDLDGVYLPETPGLLQYKFERDEDGLEISTKGAHQSDFVASTSANGNARVYSSGISGAKCVRGLIVMVSSNGSSRTDVIIEKTEDGFRRSVKRPRNPPVVTFYYKDI